MITASLTDPAATSSTAQAIGWLGGAVFGSVATIVAVIAMAGIGLLMLAGRIEARRAAVVLLGCFLIFGARGIAAPIVGGRPGRTTDPAIGVPLLTTPLDVPATPQSADPYAGAAIR